MYSTILSDHHDNTKIIPHFTILWYCLLPNVLHNASIFIFKNCIIQDRATNTILLITQLAHATFWIFSDSESILFLCKSDITSWLFMDFLEAVSRLTAMTKISNVRYNAFL